MARVYRDGRRPQWVRVKVRVSQWSLVIVWRSLGGYAMTSVERRRRRTALSRRWRQSSASRGLLSRGPASRGTTMTSMVGVVAAESSAYGKQRLSRHVMDHVTHITWLPSRDAIPRDHTKVVKAGDMMYWRVTQPTQLTHGAVAALDRVHLKSEAHLGMFRRIQACLGMRRHV